MSVIAGRREAGVGLRSGPQVRRREGVARLMHLLFLLVTSFAVIILGVLLVSILNDGLQGIDWSFITSRASRRPERAGLITALFGTLWIMALTALIAIPIGIGAAIYLEEYAPRNWWTKVLQTNIANLAGVPSVVYGLLGLGVFANTLGLGRTVITGALTMSLLVLPIIIIASQEAIRAVPLSLREAALALGGTPWQTARSHVLPAAMPGILTGTILALSRAIGETAPLLVAGASLYLTFNPGGIDSNYTVLPIQIYNWTSEAKQEFKDLAASGIVVLLAVLIAMNTVAIVLRQRFSRQARW